MAAPRWASPIIRCMPGRHGLLDRVFAECRVLLGEGRVALQVGNASAFTTSAIFSWVKDQATATVRLAWVSGKSLSRSATRASNNA